MLFDLIDPLQTGGENHFRRFSVFLGSFPQKYPALRIMGSQVTGGLEFGDTKEPCEKDRVKPL